MKTEFWTIDDTPRIEFPTRHPPPPKLQLHPSTRIEERIGRGMAELLALEKYWRVLASTSGQSRFIHTFEWQLAYLQHLEAQPEAVHYVSFFAHGQAIAIFPLQRIRRSVGRIPLWLWEHPAHPHLVLGEPLIAPEWTTPELIPRLMKVLNRYADLPWDALHFPNLLDDSIAMRLLRENPLPLSHLEQVDVSMFFSCKDMSTALAGCSGQFKRNLGRQGRKLAQHGNVTLTLAREGAELEAAYTEFLRLEASGWKGGQGKASAISFHPHLLGFYGALKDLFAPMNGSLIALLKLDGVTIAAKFCLLTGNTLYLPKMAYDEAWHTHAPGGQLLYKLLEYCCDDPDIHQLSMVTGPAWAAGRWNPESQPVWEAYIFKPRPRGLWGLSMRRLKQQFGKENAALPVGKRVEDTNAQPSPETV